MNNWLPRFYVYGYYKIVVNVPKNINTLFTCVINTFMYDYFFTHDKAMVAYKKLSPNSFLATFQL